MRSAYISSSRLLAICALALFGSPLAAQSSDQAPYAMRGVELGITLDELRKFPVPVDNKEYSDHQLVCTNDTSDLASRVEADPQRAVHGLVECQWFSKRVALPRLSPSEHWVDIGKGKGKPVFRFIDHQGALRLFEISFFANNTYHGDILDALTRGYGPPKAPSSLSQQNPAVTSRR